jgi:hypothetical protein
MAALEKGITRNGEGFSGKTWNILFPKAVSDSTSAFETNSEPGQFVPVHIHPTQVRYCDGQLANQPTAAEMYKNMDMMLHFRRVERPAASVYGGLCIAPYHFKHFDELLADMGATIRRRSPLVEKFTPPDADVYARFLASAPDYKVEPA